MYRSDFDFLEAMFPEGSCWEHQILIVNQTDDDRHLVSDHPNIRVINSSERGLSRSRNMALENAIGDICLIADDDVRYVKEVENIVVSAFAKANNPTLISFEITNGEGAPYKNYPSIRNHTRASVQNVSSVEIAFNRKQVLGFNIRFDINFGLGAEFPTAEEYIFLREILGKKGVCLFENRVILSHPEVSSGQFSGKDAIVYGRGALRYKFMGRFAYLSMIKYAWFYYRRGQITFTEIPSKIATAFAGIKKYKNLQ